MHIWEELVAFDLLHTEKGFQTFKSGTQTSASALGFGCSLFRLDILLPAKLTWHLDCSTVSNWMQEISVTLRIMIRGKFKVIDLRVTAMGDACSLATRSLYAIWHDD